MTPKILIACEQSQTIANAFRRLGYEAYSNDVYACYGGHPEYHIIGDARKVVLGNNTFSLECGASIYVNGEWDLLIANPPCTMLTHSSAVAYSKGLHSYVDVLEGARFFLTMLAAPVKYICVENPAPMRIAGLPPYNQIINPYQFGHPYSKRWCLWLRQLPPLLPESGYYVEYKRWVEHCSSTSRRRSKTFEGIAAAMANQWGDYVSRNM